MASDRRAFLLGAGALVAVTACSGSDDAAAPGPTSTAISTSSSTPTTAPTAPADPSDASSVDVEPLTPAMFTALAICTVPPSAAAGPFPNLEQLDRRDITEGYEGHPLRLGVRVVDGDCRPVEGAVVEIWHTDATGDYSAYDDGGDGKDEGEGTTFLRGFQTSDADGILEFQTIYPGWYPNRAVHVHARVRLDGELVSTTQLYFDEAYTEGVFTEAPYAEFGSPRTGWVTDALIGDPAADGSGITLTPAETSLGPGTLGLVNLGVAV